MTESNPYGRPVAGRLNGVHAEKGTLLGPNTMGETMVVIDNDEKGVICSYARYDEIIEAMKRPPQSITEREMRGGR